ncbi:MAG TPA: DinB family protein [Panacibacter sp.]|nr:DinB family protein [Panacibacter sp.]
MLQEKINTTELFASFYDCTSLFVRLAASLTEKQINTVPFKESWTAGQLLEHVTRSNRGIAKALYIKGNPAERAPWKRAQELKEMFLDFTIKFKSPDFILPTKDHYYKEDIIEDLENSVELLKAVSRNVNLAEAIKHAAFGEITKLELLYFVQFHMQRHLEQLKNISTAVVQCKQNTLR